MRVGVKYTSESAHAKFTASRTRELAVARGETGERAAREKKRDEDGRRKGNGRGRSRTEKEREKADTGIIIKRDISYVGGRIVSATRYARRFCVRARCAPVRRLRP